jgi:DNA polymerase-3 subunit delta'
MSDDAAEPDRIDGAPHPRQTPILFGQSAAEAEFLQAFASGRMHHGWLLTGPRGVGKATLAWRIARFLLATPPDDGGMFAAPAPESLDIPADHPVMARTRALSEPGLGLVRRGGAGTGDNEREKNWADGKFSNDIRVSEIRELNKFLHLSSADGGRRAVIVDAADEMNPQAANALLKLLEEPPARTTFLLVSHQPSSLLPTIRSRCRTLRLRMLDPEDMARALAQAGAADVVHPDHLAELSGGSVGAALRLINTDGLKIYAALVGVLSSLPNLDRPRALSLADSVAGPGKGDRARLLFTLVDIALSRLARTGATGAPPPDAAPGEADVLTRLAPGPDAGLRWADAAVEISARARHGLAVNLDPAGLVLDTVFKLQRTAAG